MKNQLLYIALYFLALIISCKKEDKLFITPPGATGYTCNIQGIVTDEYKIPIQGASISFNGINRTTDLNGVYFFTDVEVNSINNIVKISKPGYFETSRSFNTQRTASIQLENILSKKIFTTGLSGGKGGKKSGDNYEVNFPANSIAIASTGILYTGHVFVAIKYLNPEDSNINELMPGSLTGIDNTDALSKLTTFGMLLVEMETPNGEKLQVKSGCQVEIKVKLSSIILSKAPLTIPLWYFNDSLGYWKEEGSAELLNGEYIGKVGHFSCWNYDSYRPSVNVSGKVLDSDGNPIVGNIHFTVPGEIGGYGKTNSDGSFSGAVPMGVTLSLNIYSKSTGCAGDLVYLKEVGPYNTDMVLDDIIINVPLFETFSCSGKFKNCKGDPVQNGYLKITEGVQSHFFPVKDGEVSASIQICISPFSSIATMVNLDDVKESDPIILTGAGFHDLGTVIACGNSPDYFTIKTQWGNIDTIIYGCSLGFNPSFKFFTADNNSCGLWYDDFSTTGCIAGTYPVGGASFFNAYGGIGGPTNAWPNKIEIIQGGGVGQLIIGNYEICVPALKSYKNACGGEVHFSGSFKVHLR